ncbi:MAG: ribonucleoside triphosphate reductase [Candidatus Margulisiibacteriota bacterium]|jgi:ribonucleoside-triphosphate reductase
MSIAQILKRNTQIVKFEPAKITEAIFKAANSVGGYDRAIAEELSVKVIDEIDKRYHAKTIPAVEEIQDLVEKVLIESGHAKTAKAYILYREQHKRLRETKAMLLDIEKTMDGYLKQSDWRVNENSNVNYSLGGLILHNSGAITANYWLNNIYTSEIADAHRNGDMHIHDLSMFSGYCAGWSLRQLIMEGLGGVKNKINSKPANHLSTLISQMINFLGTMQNEWAGAQAFSSFDTYLAPFIRIDNMSFKEVKQQIQSFVFSINTPSRWGSQAPFTNITLDWVVPDDLKDRPVIIGGKELDSKYGDYQKEMDLINRAFLEVMMEGDADGRGFPYPIPTYNITRDFVWDSDNANLLFEMTAKYGTPYFQNFVNSDLNPSDVRSMCCRLQLDKRELKKRGGGLFGADEFTGSIGVVTINMGRIGYLAKNKEEYFKRLDRIMNIAKNSLTTKRKIITRLINDGLFPYTQRYLKHLNNHFSTIGIIGMNESCLNFLKQDISAPESQAFAKEVLDHMRNKLSDFQEETGDLFNLEATPGEGTSYRLAKIDKEKFSDILISGEKDPYYTNSTQLPVGLTTDIFSALDIQDSLQTKYTGGTVFHGFLGEKIDDPQACKNLVKKVAYNYRMPYFTITPTFSVCPDHGYLKGEHFFCPECGHESEVYTRIVGYYRPVQNWNLGKKSEYKERQEFAYKTNSEQGMIPMLTLEQKIDNFNLQSTVKMLKGSRVAGFKLFYTDTCSNCPPVKDYVAKLDLQGEFINATTEEGLDEAKKYGIYSTPSVILFDQESNIVTTAHTTAEIEQCLVS